jgi:hypothetical protein
VEGEEKEEGEETEELDIILEEGLPICQGTVS